MPWLDTSPKTTQARQVSVVPKNVGLVSPDANPSPNPWGQKSPIDPASHPQGEGWYHTHPRGMDPGGCLYHTGVKIVHPQPQTDPWIPSGMCNFSSHRLSLHILTLVSFWVREYTIVINTQLTWPLRNWCYNLLWGTLPWRRDMRSLTHWQIWSFASCS